MQRIIGVTELQHRFRAVFDEVAKGDTPYVLTRGSRPEVAMIPYEEYQRYQAFQEQQILARFDALTERMATQNAAVTDDEVAEDIEASTDDSKPDAR